MKVFEIILLILCAGISCNEDKGEKLPDFTIEMPDGYLYQTSKIHGNRPAMFIFFSSTCGDCQDETKELLSKMNSLKHVSFYFLTVEDTSGLNDFARFFNFSNYSNIIYGRDRDFFIPKHFHYSSTPLVAIYDKKKNLHAVLKGKAPAGKIVELLENL